MGLRVPSLVLGGISILLPVYGITNSKRYSVFRGILILLVQSSTSYNCRILSINYVRYVTILKMSKYLHSILLFTKITDNFAYVFIKSSHWQYTVSFERNTGITLIP